MEREISLKELFLVIWKGKLIIGLSALVVLLISIVGSVIYDNSSSQVATIVTMQWSGIAQGEYPDGSRFDYGEAIEPYVLTLAIDELGYDLSTTSVRNSISFTPIVPSNVLAIIETALEEGEQITYFSSDYKLVLDNGELGISVEEAVNLINEIVNQFRIDFERKFVNQVTVLDFTDADFDELDYMESYDILDSQIAVIDIAMNSRSNSGFYSPTLGITFEDILVQTNLLRRINLEQILTRTNTYLLTKDKTYLITNYRYKIELTQLNLDKATAKETEMQNLVDNYTGSVNTILIPGLENESIDLETYYNTLMDYLVNLQNEIAEHTEDIAYYQLQIDRLEGNDPSFDVSEEDQLEEAAKVIAFLSDADAELEDIVMQSNILLAEFNEYQTSNIIKPLMAPSYQSNVSLVLNSAIGILLGSAIGTIVVLFKHEWN